MIRLNRFRLQKKSTTAVGACALSPRFRYFGLTKQAQSRLQRPLTLKILLVSGVVLIIAGAIPFVSTFFQALHGYVMASAHSGLSFVEDYTQPVYDFLTSKELLVKEVAILRKQNDNLLHWKSLAIEHRHQNEELAKALHLSTNDRGAFVTVRVMAKFLDGHTQKLVIRHEGGIKQNQAVFSHEGLIGRISEVLRGHAHVLLLSDSASRVPVMSERAQAQGILYGASDGKLRIKHVKYATPHLIDSHKLKKGDVIRSSGYGGIYPPGIPIGEVCETSTEVTVVKPYVNPFFVNFVQVDTREGN